jgi:hypothetical protein
MPGQSRRTRQVPQLLLELIMAQTARTEQRTLNQRGNQGMPPTATSEPALTADRGREDVTAAEPPQPATTPDIDASGTAGAGRMDRIAARAYELYERRGGEHGRELQDWLEAERQIDGTDTDGAAGSRR